MKFLILVSMVIIFISFFFIFLIFDTVLMSQIECLTEIETCDVTNLGFSFVFGLLVMSVFIIVDILVVYILIKTITAKNAVGFILK